MWTFTQNISGGVCILLYNFWHCESQRKLKPNSCFYFLNLLIVSTCHLKNKQIHFQLLNKKPQNPMALKLIVSICKLLTSSNIYFLGFTGIAPKDLGTFSGLTSVQTFLRTRQPCSECLTAPNILTVCFVLLLQIYTDWANHYLAKSGCPRLIKDLSQDVADGVLLAQIIQIIGRRLCKMCHLTDKYY